MCNCDKQKCWECDKDFHAFCKEYAEAIKNNYVSVKDLWYEYLADCMLEEIEAAEDKLNNIRQ